MKENYGLEITRMLSLRMGRMKLPLSEDEMKSYFGGGDNKFSLRYFQFEFMMGFS